MEKIYLGKKRAFKDVVVADTEYELAQTIAKNRVLLFLLKKNSHFRQILSRKCFTVYQSKICEQIIPKV